ncbi:hypothetical protein [Spirosoma linguale]
MLRGSSHSYNITFGRTVAGLDKMLQGMTAYSPYRSAGNHAVHFILSVP